MRNHVIFRLTAVVRMTSTNPEVDQETINEWRKFLEGDELSPEEYEQQRKEIRENTREMVASMRATSYLMGGIMAAFISGVAGGVGLVAYRYKLPTGN